MRKELLETSNVDEILTSSTSIKRHLDELTTSANSETETTKTTKAMVKLLERKRRKLEKIERKEKYFKHLEEKQKKRIASERINDNEDDETKMITRLQPRLK